ncbi:MAG: four helix bundle protein [Candidatus Levybacteria bacterium]|nr:four helix bundle protein [Candidatus Levybacteria bacterium]
MQKFRFRDFKVYQDAILFRMEIKQLVRKYFPAEEKYLLSDQIIRAANSIVLNIAEGSDRGTDKDFALFLNRSHTSLAEVVACLDLALKEKFINDKIHREYLMKSENLANQLTAFRRKLLVNPTK